MNIERLAQKYAEDVPGFRLVHYYEAAFPVFRVNLNITVEKKKKLSILHEFCLRLIDEGINTSDQISGFLGVDQYIIDDVLVDLCMHDLIHISFASSNSIGSITDKGKKSLLEMSTVVPETVMFPILYDSLTGKMHNLYKSLYTIENAKIAGLYTLPKNHKQPSIDKIDFKEMSKLIKELQIKRPEDAIEGSLLYINKIDKIYLEYRKMNVLVFMNNSSDKIDLMVFEGTQRVSEYEAILLKMENEGLRVIHTEQNNGAVFDKPDDLLINRIPNEIKLSANELTQTVDKLTQKKEAIEESIREEMEIANNSEESQKITATQRIRDLDAELQEVKKKLESGNRVLNTYDHRPLLEKALDEATNLVVIVSPWINQDAFDYDLQMKVDAALKRKVNIVIGYGISNEDEKYSQKKAVQKLQEIQGRQHGKYLKLIKLGNTHEKVLICDSKFVVITSFNWLSFKGDPNRGFRQETGIYTETREVIIDMLLQLEQRMSIELKKYV